MFSLERLRLAAASAHQVPGVSMTLWPVDGPSVVVSRLAEHQPDLSPCTLRALVVAVLAGDPVPVGLRWMFDLADVTVGGTSVRHVGDGVVHVDGCGAPGADGAAVGRWWPTLIDPCSIATVMADAAADALERGLVEADVVAAADVSAHADTALGVAVVHLRTRQGDDDHERRCDSLARSMARSCVIDELLHSASSGSTTGGRQSLPTMHDLPHGRINPRSSIPFFVVHLLPFLAIFTGVPAKVWILFAATYWGRMFFITGGYHRYFSHRSYKTSRAFQFVLAFGGGMAVQKGPLWWAGHHRLHHRFADTADDPHTPRKGFWWSHAGWILCDETSAMPDGAMKDFQKYPELVFLTRHDWIAPWALGVACFLIAGLPGLLIGFLLSTVALWHSTFLINSLAHVFGSRRFVTEDTSRNNGALAILTMGEGWHNNHHKAAYVCRQGLRWWEIDATWYVLVLLEKLHVIWDVKRPRPADEASGDPAIGEPVAV